MGVPEERISYELRNFDRVEKIQFSLEENEKAIVFLQKYWDENGPYLYWKEYDANPSLGIWSATSIYGYGNMSFLVCCGSWSSSSEMNKYFTLAINSNAKLMKKPVDEFTGEIIK